MTGTGPLRHPTPTERRVMLLLDQGLKRQEAAIRLGMCCAGSVDFHLRSLFRRCEVHNIRALLAVARRQGWIPSNLGTNPPAPDCDGCD